MKKTKYPELEEDIIIEKIYLMSKMVLGKI
jgi:hypothetical protein